MVPSPLTIRRGYVNDKAATEASFVDGWLKTGDIGKMDLNQNIWITDRLKEVRALTLAISAAKY
jgi:long-subunit acyl-CoA synthetase (AMP-forming)